MKKKEKATDRLATFMTCAGLVLVGMSFTSVINLEEITSWRIVAERLVSVLENRYPVPVNISLLDDDDPVVDQTRIVRDISYALAQELGDRLAPVDEGLLRQAEWLHVFASDTILWVAGETNDPNAQNSDAHLHEGVTYYPVQDLVMPTSILDLSESLQLTWSEQRQIRPVVFSLNYYTLGYLVGGLAFLGLSRQRRRAREREEAEAAERYRAGCAERQREYERRQAELRLIRSQRLSIVTSNGVPTNGNGNHHHDPAKIRQAYSEIVSIARSTIAAINRAQQPDSWTRLHHGPEGIQQLTQLRNAIEQTLGEIVGEYQDGRGRFRWAKARRIEDLHHVCANLIGEPIEAATQQQ